MKKLIAKFLNWALRDEILTVGSIKVCHPRTTYTDTIQERTPGSGVQITAMRANSGTSFPITPQIGEFFYRTDTKALFVFIGLGEVGTTDGWFNLKQAVYA